MAFSFSLVEFGSASEFFFKSFQTFIFRIVFQFIFE
ncbi:hypothetical protein T06_16434 [Trichinella sp. T6]|nr:hypothetical protein T06_16434 [Trichinella sp. T6]